MTITGLYIKGVFDIPTNLIVKVQVGKNFFQDKSQLHHTICQKPKCKQNSLDF
jgi:hypothetical protein